MTAGRSSRVRWRRLPNQLRNDLDPVERHRGPSSQVTADFGDLDDSSAPNVNHGDVFEQFHTTMKPQVDNLRLLQ